MIDYHKIANSLDHYEKLGFKRVEAPWWVSQEITQITKPQDSWNEYYIEENRKALVASGEQSFLYMATKGRLPKGQYQTVTPCFRNESIGIFSKKCFIKNELIDTENVNQQGLNKMLDHAIAFFEKYCDRQKLHLVSNGGEQWDIMYGAIELGSYGIRSCEFLDWVYGTGCAEPRLSRAIRVNER